MTATLELVESIAPNIKTFWFRPEKPVNNVPGQFTELYLPHSNPDARGQKRWFTIYSSPTEELFAITTKFSQPSSTYMRTLQALQVGSTHSFAEPMGDFILPKDKSLPLVFVAAGIGITPFRSIIKWLTDTNQDRDITLIYNEQSAEQFIATDVFDTQVKTIHYILSRPTNTWTGLTGHLTSERILNLAPQQSKTLYYISGPESLVEKLTDDLRQSVPSHHVITDYFPGYANL